MKRSGDVFERKTCTRWLGLISTSGVIALTASPASAEVTLYGIMDLGVTRVSNQDGAAITKISSGEVQQSRFGIRGTEDVGAGMKVFFNLESGIAVDTGALVIPNNLWSREARVGISTPAGTVALGRQAAALVDYLAKFTSSMLVYGTGYYTIHPGNHDRVLNIPVDNAVKYQSPVFSGFSMAAHYGFGEQPGSTSRLTTWSFAAGYENGPFNLGAGYFKADGPSGAAAFLAPSANPFTPSNPSDATDTFGVGASYAFGSSLLHALVTQTKFQTADNTARSYELGMRWNPVLAWTFGGNLSRTVVLDHSPRMNIASLSAAYALSKRTDVYGTFAAERVSGRNILGGPLTAQMFSQGASTTDHQNVARIAIRHKF